MSCLSRSLFRIHISVAKPAILHWVLVVMCSRTSRQPVSRCRKQASIQSGAIDICPVNSCSGWHPQRCAGSPRRTISLAVTASFFFLFFMLRFGTTTSRLPFPSSSWISGEMCNHWHGVSVPCWIRQARWLWILITSLVCPWVTGHSSVDDKHLQGSCVPLNSSRSATPPTRRLCSPLKVSYSSARPTECKQKHKVLPSC